MSVVLKKLCIITIVPTLLDKHQYPIGIGTILDNRSWIRTTCCWQRRYFRSAEQLQRRYEWIDWITEAADGASIQDFRLTFLNDCDSRRHCVNTLRGTGHITARLTAGKSNQHVKKAQCCATAADWVVLCYCCWLSSVVLLLLTAQCCATAADWVAFCYCCWLHSSVLLLLTE